MSSISSEYSVGKFTPTTRPVHAANRLLTSFTHKDRQHFIAGCEQVELVLGHTLSEPGEVMRYVYFPTGGFISMIMPIAGGAKLEVGLIGDEGMFGIPLVLGINISPLQALVQGAGSALRMDAALFIQELEQTPALLKKMHRYIYVSMSQLAQTAACNRFHLVEQLLARWLLMTQRRAHSDTFHITQDFLAQMLGVRRVGVTKAAGALQKRELISYSRGSLHILDMAGLEAASCSCFRADKDTYTRILSG